jgi:hypothetical protein
MNDSLEIQISNEVGEKAVIVIKEITEHPDDLLYRPGELPWLNIQLQVFVSTFQGTVNDIMSMGQIQEFYTELSNLYESLEGTARLNTILELFSVNLERYGSGYMLASFEIDNDFVYLRFGLGFDQTSLPGLMDQLKRVIAAYDERKSD